LMVVFLDGVAKHWNMTKVVQDDAK
jgi:hypothetical protein